MSQTDPKKKKNLNLLFPIGSHKRAIVQGRPQRSEQQRDVGNNGFAVESQQTRSPQSVRNTYTLFLECICLSLILYAVVLADSFL